MNKKWLQSWTINQSQIIQSNKQMESNEDSRIESSNGNQDQYSTESNSTILIQSRKNWSVISSQISRLIESFQTELNETIRLNSSKEQQPLKHESVIGVNQTSIHHKSASNFVSNRTFSHLFELNSISYSNYLSQAIDNLMTFAQNSKQEKLRVQSQNQKLIQEIKKLQPTFEPSTLEHSNNLNKSKLSQSIQKQEALYNKYRDLSQKYKNKLDSLQKYPK